MEPTYAGNTDLVAQLNALNPRVILLTSSSGLASQIEAATMAQVAACEYTGDSTRYPTRPSITFAATTDTTNRRVRAVGTVTIPAHTTTPTFVRYAIVCDIPGGASGSATVGSTTGQLRYLTGTAFSQATVATNELIITLAIEFGGRNATFSA
jgi:hypothetical protein